jgi:hypothetical protein
MICESALFRGTSTKRGVVICVCWGMFRARAFEIRPGSRSICKERSALERGELRPLLGFGPGGAFAFTRLPGRRASAPPCPRGQGADAEADDGDGDDPPGEGVVRCRGLVAPGMVRRQGA